MIKPPKAGLRKSRRKTIKLNADALVKQGCLYPEKGMPTLFQPGMDGVDLVQWVGENRVRLEQELHRNGALLFRGFNVENVDRFQQFCGAVSPDLLDYVERAAPRQQLAGKVFTSTEYPADQWIPLHHEMSYSHNWPTKLFFYCDIPAEKGGATPFTNERKTMQDLPEELKRPFLEKGVMYVRNYGEGVDMPWPEVFQTTDKKEVEAYLERTGSEYQWIGGDRLRTISRRQVTATHPVTGDTVWFNHAHMFHISNMPGAVREALQAEFGPMELPRNSCYGDGTPIEDEVAGAIRDFYRETSISFTWQRGDILVLDNFLTAHGRAPFEGSRRICVAMAELYTNPDFV